jgi:hypothetical protein
MHSSLAQALAKGGNYTQHYRIVQRDGPCRWSQARGGVHRNAEGQAVRGPGVCIESAEHQATDALRESEQFTEVCRKIVQRPGAEMRVESELRQGSTSSLHCVRTLATPKEPSHSASDVSGTSLNHQSPRASSNV